MNFRDVLIISPQLLKKQRKKCNQWLLCDLSLRGMILLSKAEGISRLTYIYQSLYVDQHTCKSADKMLFDFIWKNHTHYLKKSVLMNEYNKCGLHFLDFTTLNDTFKIKWIP